MKKIFLLFFCCSLGLADGWVRVYNGGFEARLESFKYKVFRAKADTKNAKCDVFIGKRAIIEGKIKKESITLKLLPLGTKTKGGWQKDGSLLLELGKEIFATSVRDVGENTHFNITGGTKLIIRKDGKDNLYISSNASYIYELALICAYLVK